MGQVRQDQPCLRPGRRSRLSGLVLAGLALCLLAETATAQLRASILPSVRAARLGTDGATVTAFATVINVSDAARSDCRVVLDGAATGLSLDFQRTDAATNGVIGEANTPFELGPRQAQSLVIAVTGESAVSAELAPSFQCDGASPAPVRSGVNTLDVTFSEGNVMDVIPIGVALPDQDGVVRANRVGGRGLMALAAVNIGANGRARIEAEAESADGGFPGGLLICETDSEGACLGDYAPYLDIDFGTNEVRTFNALLIAPDYAGITFAPGSTRLRVTFFDRWRDRLAGQTGAAVAAPAPQGLELSFAEASRFLVQASFGPSMEEVRAVAQNGVEAWLDAQLAMPIDPQETHWAYVQRGGPPECVFCEAQYANAFHESFWRRAVMGEDQLRQRMAFALSEIFVISSNNSGLENELALAGWYDMLTRNAFGNYRDLLEDVARSPAMGIYLSHMRNEREDEETGRIPDENFAREVMQLFSIGLWMLEPDGTRTLDAFGAPIPTYGQEEISGMARVMTGWSWNAPTTDDGYWHGWSFYPDPPSWNEPMQMYERYHSTNEKPIISGVVIPPNTSGEDSLRIALDTLFDHPSTAPFISRQLIQRFVTSNPSPAYVARITAVFEDNGSGERGDLAAVLRAILLDPEARDAERADDEDWGKLREPVLRFSAWARAFDVRPPEEDDFRFQIWNLGDPVGSLGQQPLASPSVFNFFRPDYAPPGALAEAGLQAPEFQITHETTVTGYANFSASTARGGYWRAGGLLPDYEDEYLLVGQPSALAERLNILMAGGALSPEARALITAAMAEIDVGAWDASRRRLATAVAMVMAAPGFVVQQ